MKLGDGLTVQDGSEEEKGQGESGKAQAGQKGGFLVKRLRDLMKGLSDMTGDSVEGERMYLLGDLFLGGGFFRLELLDLFLGGRKFPIGVVVGVGFFARFLNLAFSTVSSSLEIYRDVHVFWGRSTWCGFRIPLGLRGRR